MNYELRITNYELPTGFMRTKRHPVNYELRITNYELPAGYMKTKRHPVNYELRITNYELPAGYMKTKRHRHRGTHPDDDVKRPPDNNGPQTRRMGVVHNDPIASHNHV